MAVQAIQLNNQLNQQELMSTLKGSLYPDASDESVKLVLSYCKALRLDPVMRVVHIVKFGNKEVLLPGIGLYRTLAHRSGVYAGLSEPEYGPTITEEFQKPIIKWNRAKKHDGTFYNKKEIVGHESIKVSYPEWCKITARKLVQGKIVETTTIEYWKENYASLEGGCPNDMWMKRPHGQISKCTEAQCLRKMFPEFVPQQPTFEEMEGKELINHDYIDATAEPAEVVKPASSADSVKQKLKSKFNVERPVEAKQVIEVQTEPQPQLKIKEQTKNHLKFLIGHCQITQEVINNWFKRAGIFEWEDFKEETAIRIIEKLESNNFEAKQAWIDFLKAREAYSQEQTEGVVAHA